MKTYSVNEDWYTVPVPLREGADPAEDCADDFDGGGGFP